MTLRWLRGDCRETLRTLEAGSVQCAITSPPYWSLRDYGTPPLVWGGDAEHAHEWGAWAEVHDVREEAIAGKTRTTERFYGEASRKFDGNHQKHAAGAHCSCGAWLGSLGLEPDPFMYIEHIVEVFREVRRVLRDDGVIWVNLGSSYAGSGKGPSNSIQPDASQLNKGRRNTQQFANGQAPTQWVSVPSGFKPKDMIFMPGFVAEALRQDGWYFRAMLPWVKRNCMPSSVTDRPGTSLEYVLYLSKSRRCYWDADAVRVGQAAGTAKRYEAPFVDRYDKAAAGGYRGKFGGEDGFKLNPNGRAFRDSDLFFQSWQGLLLDDDAEPMALVVNPAPLKLAHYASYPPKLVEPMVKASTSEKGQCPACGAPWVRVTETESTVQGPRGTQPSQFRANLKPPQQSGISTSSKTLGWRAGCTCCACPDNQELQLPHSIGYCVELPPVPQTVLDPFAGSGTTLMVADRLGRNAIGCELSESYGEMGTGRVVGDAPMFVELTSA